MAKTKLTRLIAGVSIRNMYLNCVGWNEQQEEGEGEEEDGDTSNTQTDCRTYLDDGMLTSTNRYSIKE
jgi:hypothetical protein